MLQQRSVRVLNREKHGPQFCQPLGLHSSDALHVLLGGQKQLVVNHILGCVTQPIEGTAWVQMAWHTIPRVNILANPLLLCRVMEICRTDSLSNNIPVRG
uniref:Uncharacterized protein n=1 Tax=Opuntia streptacantha TaxID=393608 RepID=A0A7C9AJN6_OPUST